MHEQALGRMSKWCRSMDRMARSGPWGRPGIRGSTTALPAAGHRVLATARRSAGSISARPYRRSAIYCLRRRPRPWVLMYVFSYSVSPAATNDRAEWRLLPTVVFQEFSNEERCKAAKSKLESSLREAGAKLKSGLED